MSPRRILPAPRVSIPALVGSMALGAAVYAGWLRSNAQATLQLADVRRTTVAPGVEVLHGHVRRAGKRAGRLVAIFAEPEAVELGLRLNPDRAALEQIAPEADLVVNAGYFTEAFRPTGLLVSAGRTLSPFVRQAGGAGSGVFVLDDRGARLLARDAIGERRFEDAQVALQAGPRIIEPGGRPGIRSDDGARANRTVIGADRRGRVVVLVVHNAASGLAAGPTLFELMTLLGPGLGEVDPSLALDFALNLDGGPSTGVSVRSRAAPTELPEAHPVLSAITLRRRP